MEIQGSGEAAPHDRADELGNGESGAHQLQGRASTLHGLHPGHSHGGGGEFLLQARASALVGARPSVCPGNLLGGSGEFPPQARAGSFMVSIIAYILGTRLVAAEMYVIEIGLFRHCLYIQMDHIAPVLTFGMMEEGFLAEELVWIRFHRPVNLVLALGPRRLTCHIYLARRFHSNLGTGSTCAAQRCETCQASQAGGGI